MYEAEVEAVGLARQYPPLQYPPLQYPPRQHHRQPEYSDQFTREQRYPLPPPQSGCPSQPATYDRTYADPRYNRPQQYPQRTGGYQPQRSAVMCFACGVKKHRRPECTDPPLPMDEQRELYESIMPDRGYARVPRNDRYNPNREYGPEEYTDSPYVNQSERQSERYRPPMHPPQPPPPQPHRQAKADKPDTADRTSGSSRRARASKALIRL